MTDVVVVGSEGSAVVGAFREETNSVIVVPAKFGPTTEPDVTALVEELTGSRPLAVIAASAASAPAARDLQRALGFDDGLGALPLEHSAQRAAVDSAGPGNGERCAVALVSSGGAHASAGVYGNRFVPGSGHEELRSRISLPFDSDTAAVAEEAARGYLDRFGVIDGACCVEMEIREEDTRLVGISPGVLSPAPAIDASFRAFGHSHEHLLTESVLRPREFERRLVRPLQPGRTTLGIIALRAPSDGVLRGAATLRTIRRLTGFYSLGEVRPGATLAPGAIAAVATFVHADRASVANSLGVIAEIEDVDSVFVEDYQVIGLAPTAS